MAPFRARSPLRHTRPEANPSTRSAAATVVLVVHEDLESALTRLRRDLVPSLDHYPTWRFELIVVDNSDSRLEPLAECVAALKWPTRYVWNEGRNLRYGPSLNLAARCARYPVLLYVCARHGKALDPRWIEGLVEPLLTNERAAMTGHSTRSPVNARRFGIRYCGPSVHIQGGVFAARTNVTRHFPYDEGEHAHSWADVRQSYQLLAAGLALVNVPSVMSVWRAKARRGPWHYVHDESEG